MEKLPIYISIVFGLTTCLTVILFSKATNNSKITFLILTSWIALQTFVGLSGFYRVTAAIPPRFLLLILPPLIFIAGSFFTRRGRKFIDGLNMKILILLHTIRIPVELILFWLFAHKAVPQLMTFEGRNFDILSGLSAPLVFYYGFIKKKLDKRIILIWNFVCLALLINIVINAVLSAPFPFQKFAFDQPNIAILYFPFIWLPCCVVPIVLISHIAAIRQILNEKEKQQTTFYLRYSGGRNAAEL